MHLRLLARQASTHPLFQRSTKLAPRDLEWDQNSHLKRNFKRSGLVGTSFMSWGNYGMLCGLLEGLSDHPIEGEVTVTVSRGSFNVSGKIEVFDLSRQPVIYQSLLAAERVAHDLSFDSYVTSVSVTYTQHIKELEGGAEVE